MNVHKEIASFEGTYTNITVFNVIEVQYYTIVLYATVQLYVNYFCPC